MNAYHSQPPHDDDDELSLAHAADDGHDFVADDHAALLGMLQARGEVPTDTTLSRRLDGDATLRAESESLGELDAMLRGMVARSDGGAVSASTSDRALNASIRLMREQALIRRQNGGSLRRRARRSIPTLPRWAWATAAAAAIAVGFAFWSAGTDPDTKLAKYLPITVGEADPGSTSYAGSDSENATEIQKQIDALNFIAQTGDASDASADTDPSAGDLN